MQNWQDPTATRGALQGVVAKMNGFYKKKGGAREATNMRKERMFLARTSFEVKGRQDADADCFFF